VVSITEAQKKVSLRYMKDGGYEESLTGTLGIDLMLTPPL